MKSSSRPGVVAPPMMVGRLRASYGKGRLFRGYFPFGESGHPRKLTFQTCPVENAVRQAFRML
jgi:hypothetical protein